MKTDKRSNQEGSDLIHSHHAYPEDVEYVPLKGQNTPLLPHGIITWKKWHEKCTWIIVKTWII